MATRTFVNLNPYEAAQLNRRANTLSPLDALLQGAQQGLELQQLPGKLQDQALARQLNNAMVAQRLQDLQNPEAALARKLTQELTLKGALNPDLGIQAAPAGLTGVTIANPGAITPQQQAALPSQELMDLRQLAMDAGGADIPNVIPTAAPGLPETPISVFGRQTGLNIDPNVPIKADADKLNRDIALANARVRSSSPTLKGQFIPDGFGGMIFAQQPTTVGGDIVTTRVQTPEGSDVKVNPKGVKNILAINEKTGRVTNIALAPGEGLPEGFKQQTKVSEADFKSIDAFRKEISNNDTVKQFTDVQKAKQRIDLAMQEAKATNNFTVVDQALISSFNRLLEPDSVTMVSEYARTSADAPIINRIKANITRITQGGRLSPEERDAVSKLSDRIYNTSLGNFSKTMDFYEGIGDRRGWIPEDYIPPLAAFTSSTEVPSASTTAPASNQSIGRFKLINVR